MTAPERRQRVSDSEKITINLGHVDLGHVDLLVDEGFYSNRTDFIRTAIRNQLATHREATARSIDRRSLELGMRRVSKAELEDVLAAGDQLELQVLGLLAIEADVTPDLALRTITTITVLGALQAPPDVRAALADRIR